MFYRETRRKAKLWDERVKKKQERKAKKILAERAYYDVTLTLLSGKEVTFTREFSGRVRYFYDIVGCQYTDDDSFVTAKEEAEWDRQYKIDRERERESIATPDGTVYPMTAIESIKWSKAYD